MGNQFNFQLPDLLTLYSQVYDEATSSWREIGARDKVSNLKACTASIFSKVNRILEVGCGTGAVLRELAISYPDREYVGIEISDERKDMAQGISKNGMILQTFDGKHIPFEDNSFDFVYATHVLEHVADDRGFLREIRRVAQRFVYIEVPCELHIRTTRNALQGSLSIGHINAYTPDSFQLKLETSGLLVREIRAFDHSFAIHRFRTSKTAAVTKMAMRRLALAVSHRFASHIFTYHWGALCEVGPVLNIS